jgi:cytochrome c peroxidase
MKSFERKKIQTVGHPYWLLLLGCAVVGVVLILYSEASAEKPGGFPKTEHDAVKMEVQEQELDKLMLAKDVTSVPAGFDAVVWQAFIPEDNTMTSERVALGRKLYFDKRLSKDGTVSCATCHDVTRGFTDQRKVSEGIKDQNGTRNAPTTLNVALLQILFLDGRSPTLEHQARQPIVNPIEMGMPSGEDAVLAIRGDAEYQKAFESAYGRPVNYEDMGRAMAAFERTLIFIDSPFRKFLKGDRNAISADAEKGWTLFNGKARCVTCHPINTGNPLGTDNKFHNVGVSARTQDFDSLAKKALAALTEDSSEAKLDELALSTELGELGRFMVTNNRPEIGSFRTPMLLNIGITPPYMHDGSLPTLWDVIDHYNKGGEANAFLDGAIEPLALEEEEINQIVALLFSMTDARFAAQNDHQHETQKAMAEKERPFKDDDLAFRRKIPFEDRARGIKGGK